MINVRYQQHCRRVIIGRARRSQLLARPHASSRKLMHEDGQVLTASPCHCCQPAESWACLARCSSAAPQRCCTCRTTGSWMIHCLHHGMAWHAAPYQAYMHACVRKGTQLTAHLCVCIHLVGQHCTHGRQLVRAYSSRSSLGPVGHLCEAPHVLKALLNLLALVGTPACHTGQPCCCILWGPACRHSKQSVMCGQWACTLASNDTTAGICTSYRLLTLHCDRPSLVTHTATSQLLQEELCWRGHQIACKT